MNKHFKGRILVVDDEEFCLASIRFMLGQLGVDIDNKVDFAIDGKEALLTLKQSYSMAMTYSIIFSDISMPVMNGYESTQAIRDFLQTEVGIRREQQPFIVGVTGHVEERYRQ